MIVGALRGVTLRRRRREDVFVTIIGSRVYVTISRRNLRQLNAILDHPNGRQGCLTRKDENGVSFVLQVEDDADHYSERLRAAMEKKMNC
jgi:hypothetical protein